jgi:hypothetical protein
METLLETINDDPDLQLRIILHFLPQARIRNKFKINLGKQELLVYMIYRNGKFWIQNLSEDEEPKDCILLAEDMLKMDFNRTLNYIIHHILVEADSNMTNDYQRVSLPPLDIHRILDIIKKNPVDSAKRFLRSRHIDVSILPENSFYASCNKQGQFDAIVFTDSEEHLLYKRFFAPMAGSPHHLNLGLLHNAIFDKTFHSYSETVFVTDEVLDALSMQSFSAISIFSYHNHFTNSYKLGWYLKEKQVILAFSNTTNGNFCARYYQCFLNSTIPVKSFKRLTLPEGFDLNDLLTNNQLDAYLSDQKHYIDFST